MASSRPIVCTLTAADKRDRGGAWAKVLGSGLVTRERIPGGIAFRAAPGASEALGELVDLERECCAWIDFKVEPDGVIGGIKVFLTAEGDGESALAGMFSTTSVLG